MIIFSKKNAKYILLHTSTSHESGTSIVARLISEHSETDLVIRKTAPIATRAIFTATGTQSSSNNRRPKSSPSHMNRNNSNSNNRSGRNAAATSATNEHYEENQWSAPSLETLAREFKEVVKTAHRIRANEENDVSRIGKGMSDEAMTAIERCEKRRDYLLNQIREYELRRVQKIRIRNRSKIINHKKNEMIQNNRNKIKNRKKGMKDNSNPGLYRFGRPNTPSILTRFKQSSDLDPKNNRNQHRNQSRNNTNNSNNTNNRRPRTAIGNGGAWQDSYEDQDEDFNLTNDSNRRPQSSPTRRTTSNRLNESNRGVSMPALHAVTSPQRPFYPNQDLYGRVASSSKTNNKSRSQKSKSKKKKNNIYVVQGGGRNKLDHSIGVPPSLKDFKPGKRLRPSSALRPVSATNLNSERGFNVHDPNQQWYTGHYDSDVNKLNSNVQNKINQYNSTAEISQQITSKERPSTAAISRSKSSSRNNTRNKTRSRRPQTAVQGAKGLLRMVQATKDQTHPVDMNSSLLQNDGEMLNVAVTRPVLPPWSTRSNREDVDAALGALDYQNGADASPYQMFPT